MDGLHMDGALIWSLAIIAGPIILGVILAYAMTLRRRRNAPDRAAPEYRADPSERERR